ncbi:hypothetical protein P154DRAFT_625818 [Amniculicola lignicola CBS 123094]|uniref:Carbohydrate-binding module family 18 protein n=1 Tax=Amniculicola lignicola CBS 123094 TaxID=1392246 RepID=A0A6A5VYA3_9PLEO|nr:hypothetical protein P154DRAFT_625818 [Amniculicola lignicola CBS 123094]
MCLRVYTLIISLVLIESTTALKVPSSSNTSTTPHRSFGSTYEISNISPTPNLTALQPIERSAAITCANRTEPGIPLLFCRDKCYNPNEKQCCPGGAICLLSEDCGPTICCPAGQRQCGREPHCYDPNQYICCSDPGDNWFCSIRETCTGETNPKERKGCCGPGLTGCGGTCIDKERYRCCPRANEASGHCGVNQTCCGNDCCAQGQMCALVDGSPQCFATPAASRGPTGNGTVVANRTGVAPTKRPFKSRPPAEQNGAGRVVFGEVDGLGRQLGFGLTYLSLILFGGFVLLILR